MTFRKVVALSYSKDRTQDGFDLEHSTTVVCCALSVPFPLRHAAAAPIIVNRVSPSLPGRQKHSPANAPPRQQAITGRASRLARTPRHCRACLAGPPAVRGTTTLDTRGPCRGAAAQRGQSAPKPRPTRQQADMGRQQRGRPRRGAKPSGCGFDYRQGPTLHKNEPERVHIRHFNRGRKPRSRPRMWHAPSLLILAYSFGHL